MGIQKLDPHGKLRASALETIRSVHRKAANGELKTVLVVYATTDGCWGSQGSLSTDSRSDAAMLIELALRRLDFVTAG